MPSCPGLSRSRNNCHGLSRRHGSDDRPNRSAKPRRFQYHSRRPSGRSGTQEPVAPEGWIPAFAGMTLEKKLAGSGASPAHDGEGQGVPTCQPSSARLSSRSRSEKPRRFECHFRRPSGRSGIQESDTPEELDSRLRGNDIGEEGEWVLGQARRKTAEDKVPTCQPSSAPLVRPIPLRKPRRFQCHSRRPSGRSGIQGSVAPEGLDSRLRGNDIGEGGRLLGQARRKTGCGFLDVSLRTRSGAHGTAFAPSWAG